MDDILNNLLNDRMEEIEQYLSGFKKWENINIEGK